MKNHGVDETIIARVVEASKQFFDLPDEEKTKASRHMIETSTLIPNTLTVQLDIHKSSNFKGYTALLGENTNPENRGDLHEGFDIGPELSTEDPTNISMAGSNVWPEPNLIPGFRQVVLDY